MAKILITGATGLIGTRLARTLFQQGHDIIVQSRDPAKVERILGFPCETSITAEVLSQIEVVVNLAGESVAAKRWSAEQKEKIRSSRVDGTRRLVEGFSKLPNSKLKTWIGASAIGIYGDRGDEELTELSSLGSDFLAGVCKEWESVNAKARVCSIRIGIVLALQGGALDQLLPVYKKGLGGPVGSGKNWMSWIHLDDLVSLIETAIRDDRYQGPINGVSPKPVTSKEFAKELGQVLGKPAVIPAPALALKAALGEMSAVVLSSQRVLPSVAEKLGFKFKFPTLELALQDLCEEIAEGDEIFHSEQWVPVSPEKVFPFFCDEKNLEALTPPWLSFNVVGKSTPQIQEGTLIRYRLKVHKIPVEWVTRIERWEPTERFVDTQLKGPYSKWHHLHEFKSVRAGTWLTDHVRFRLPMGALGKIAMGAKVLKDVNAIFEYRHEQIVRRFGNQAKNT